jgi:hypothetical protein
MTQIALIARIKNANTTTKDTKEHKGKLKIRRKWTRITGEILICAHQRSSALNLAFVADRFSSSGSKTYRGGTETRRKTQKALRR